MIKVSSVSKSFGSQIAVKDVSLEIQKGEVIGFMGQNGAGKTTLMRMLTGYLSPSSGHISIDGLNVEKESLKVNSKIGYLPESPPLYLNMTVKAYLKFAAQLKDVPRNSCDLNIERVLTECDLKDVYGKMIGTLSKGYKQRVGIAQAIINNPPILILDEPTSGLDPVQVQHVRKLIKNLESQHTVILSTHVLSEIEEMAKRILFIKEGRIITDDTLKNILVDGYNLEEYFLRTVGYIKNE